MKKTSLLFILLLSLISISAQEKSINQKKYTLKEAFSGYLNAAKSRNIEALKTYLTNKDKLPFVNAGGKLITEMDEYLDAQKGWFADTTWTYESEIVSYQEFEKTGVVIDKTALHYTKDGKKSTFSMMVTYVFRKENGYWKIVTDVCTAIN